MKLSLKIVLMFVCSGLIYSQNTKLLPIVVQGKWGAIDENGRVVITPKFNKIELFVNGEAVAFEHKKKGVINEKGNWVIQPNYDKIQIVELNGNNAYKIWLNGTCGIIDKHQEVILDIKYQDISLHNDFFFCKSKGMWQVGEIASEKLITNRSFDRILKTSHYFIGIVDNVNTVITPSGDVLDTDCNYFIEKNNILIGIDSTGLPSLFCSNGTEVLNKEYQFGQKEQAYIQQLIVQQRLSLVIKNNSLPNELFLTSSNLSGLFSCESQDWLIKGNFDAVSRLTKNLFLVSKNNLKGIADSNSALISEVVADNIFQLANFLVWEKDEKYGLFDTLFNEILPVCQDNLAIQSNTILFYNCNGMYGVVDANGAVVSKAIYNSIIKQGGFYKAYTNDYLVLYEFNEKGVFQSEKKFSNVVIIKSKMEHLKSTKTTNDLLTGSNSNLVGFGWYRDSIPYVLSERPFDTLYTYKWGMKDDNDSIRIKPIYVAPKILSNNYSLGYYKKPFRKLPKELPKIKSLPYDKRFDIIHNISQQKVNETAFLNVNFADSNKVDFISFLNKKGLGIMDQNYQLIRNDIDFVDTMANEATRFCIGTNEIKYEKEDVRAIFSNYYWSKNGALLSDGITSFSPPNSFIIFKGAKWGFLNNDGSELVSPQFNFANNFNKNVAFVYNEYWGAINKDSIIIPLVYSEISDFACNSSQLYLVKTVPSKVFTFFDTLGQPVELDYTIVQSLSEGNSLVRTKNGFGIIDSDGNWRLNPTIKRKPQCKNDYCIIKDKKYGVIDFDGNQLVGCVYDNIDEYLGDGLVAINKSNKIGVGNSDGEVIIEPSASSVKLENDLIKLNYNGAVKLYTYTGQLISNKKWEYADINSSKELIMQVKKGKTVLNNLLTNEKVNVIHKPCIRFENNLLIIRDDICSFHFGAVNSEGELVLPTDFNDITALTDELFLVSLGNKMGVYSGEGNVVIQCLYKKIIPVFDNYFAAVKNGKIDFYTNDGDLVYTIPGLDAFICNEQLVMIKRMKSVVYLNSKFENHFNEVFLDGFPFSGNYTSVLTDEGWVIIGLEGQILCVGMNNKLEPRGNNLFQYVDLIYFGLYDADGKQILDPIYNKITYLDSGIIRCEREGKIGYITTDGNWIHPID